MSYLFLDIDGVLTTVATGFRTGDPPCVKRLNLITDATGAAIVVSSTWRFAPDIADILKGWGVKGELAGITPDLARHNASGIHVAVERGQEIACWLAEHNASEVPFVILDDDNDMANLLPRLVRTNSRIGLQDGDVVRAIVLLLEGER
jgi:hypothetical protein